MTGHDPDGLQRETARYRRGTSRSTWVLIGFLAVGGYFLLTEHRAHAIAYLPYLLLLACPLMHLFHHHGGHHHGSGGHSAHTTGEESTKSEVNRGAA
jgi:hypothetical protein